MAQLPSIRDNGVVIQGPRSRVTADDVSRPFQQLAQVLSDAAAPYKAKALDDAEIEGQNAVYRDPDGTLQVKLKGDPSQVARTYDRVARQSYLARLSGDIRAKGAELATEARGNPDTFNATYKGFRDELVAKAPRDMRGPVAAMLEGEGAKFAVGVSEKKRQFDIRTGEANLKAEATALDDEASALAMKGGTGTPDYKERLDRISSIYGELTANPEFGLGAREAEIELKRMESRHIGYSLIGQIDGKFEAGGVPAAGKLVESILKDESLLLSSAERRQLHGMASERLGNLIAIRKAELEPVKERAAKIIGRLNIGDGIDNSDVDETARNLAVGGDVAGVIKLINARASARFFGMSDADQVSILEEAKTASSPMISGPGRDSSQVRAPANVRNAISGAAQRHGVSAAALMKIANIESSMNPNAKNPNSSAGGLFQQIDANARQYGVKNRFNADESADGAARFMKDNANHLRRVLGREPTDGELYLAHQQGPGGAGRLLADPGALAVDVVGSDTVRLNGGNASMTAGEFAQKWIRKADGKGAQADYSGIDPEILKDWQAEVTSDTKNLFDHIRTGLLRSETPSAEDMTILNRQLSVINDPDFKQEAERFLQAEGYASSIDLLPPEESASVISSLRGDAADGASVAQQELLTALQRHQDAKTKALTKSPIGFAVSKGLAPNLQPLDFSQPGELARAFSERQRAVDALEARGLAMNAPATLPEDVIKIAKLWSSGDPKSIRALTETMASTLSPKTLARTLSSGDVRTAVKGAAFALAPEKHVEAMRALDLIDSSLGIFEVERSFGKETADRLQDWQSRVRYFSDKETAEWLKQRNDPDWAGVIKPIVEKGHKEARAVSFDDIAEGLGVGVDLSAGRLFGADAPIDDTTKRMMVADFETVFADRYAVSQDANVAKEQALKRMQPYWGKSNSNSGRLMYLPPEAHFSPIGGSLDWIGADLQETAKAQGFNLENASLVADRKTESSVMNGELPGYLISIFNPETGTEDLLQDNQGRALRWSPDPASATAKTALRYGEDRTQYRPLSRDAALDQFLNPPNMKGPSK